MEHKTPSQVLSHQVEALAKMKRVSERSVRLALGERLDDYKKLIDLVQENHKKVDGKMSATAKAQKDQETLFAQHLFMQKWKIVEGVAGQFLDLSSFSHRSMLCVPDPARALKIQGEFKIAGKVREYKEIDFFKKNSWKTGLFRKCFLPSYSDNYYKSKAWR
jgi:hypothetical protein